MPCGAEAVSTFLADIASAWRGLRTRPAFLVTVVFTLALGIGALAAVFSVYDAVLLKPLPFADAAQLVSVTRAQADARGGDSPVPQFNEWRERSGDAFVAMGAYAPDTMNLTGAGDAERLALYKVTPGFWDVFGQPLARGRAFGDDEENHAVRVIVLGDALWRTRFGADPGVVGRDVELNGEGYRVVGVARPGFRFPAEAQAWIPTYAPGHAHSRRDVSFLRVVARLREGVSPPQAAMLMRATTDWQAATFPATDAGLSAEVVPLAEAVGRPLSQPLSILLAAAGLVLLIACANLANLMLARLPERARELAVRRALGARSRRLLGPLVAEAVIICVLGTLAGLALAVPVIAAPVRFDADLLPGYNPPLLDLRVVAVIALVSVCTVLAFSLVPAWRAIRVDARGAMQSATRGNTSARGDARLRRLLVVAEIALATGLLGSAGLLIDSMRRLDAVQPGVDARQVLTAQFSIATLALKPGDDLSAWAGAAMERLTPRLVAIEQRLREIAGVESVSLSLGLPASGIASWSSRFRVIGAAAEPEQSVQYRFVSPDYFRTFGIPVEQGRAFDALDGTEALLPTSMLVNRAFADRYLAGSDALTRQIVTFGDDPIPVVGVVGDVRQSGLDRDAHPEVYFPISKAIKGELAIALKVQGDAMAYAGVLRAAMREIAPEAPLFAVRPLDEVIGATVALRRFNMRLTTAFAGIALLLAAVGLYGVIAYAARQRRREIGLRQAIGADAPAILRLMLGDGLRLIVPGLVLGLVAALVLGRFVASQLYGVGAADPGVLAIVIGVLAAVSLLACMLPARRASRISPMEALRDE